MAYDYKKLSALNVNEHVEKKKTGSTELSYLSWAWAWDEFMKNYPEATYEIKMFDGKPFIYDESTGYMVFTSVTVDGLTRDMWLPVMDSHNASMKSSAYEVKTKCNSYTVAACTMFDINKTIMRCLVKNLAMFGLGLYIYSGEDLPQSEDDEPVEKANVIMPPSEPKFKADIVKTNEIEDKLRLYQKIKDLKIDEKKMLECYHCSSIQEMSIENLNNAISRKMTAVSKEAS